MKKYYKIIFIVISIVFCFMWCLSDNKEPAIVQKKTQTPAYNQIYYRNISNWGYGKINVGIYDYNTLNPGDTIYISAKYPCFITEILTY